MKSCTHCGAHSADDSNYCPKCGRRLLNSDEYSDEKQLIQHYFNCGYAYEVIVDFMSKHHGVSVSLSTLKRRLKEYGLKKRNCEVDEEKVRQLIKLKMAHAGEQSGYRTIWHTIRLVHKIHPPRGMVAKILWELNPEASLARRFRRLKRRHYVSPGPNYCWHVDGYDKLKPFGFPIHAAIDGYSRKRLWLEVVKSNNTPTVPGKLYLDTVKEVKGCPVLVRTDCGTENGVMAAMQCYFRVDGSDQLSGENSHQYGTSTRNQRIENFWSHFRKMRSHWWINFFKDMSSSGVFDDSNELAKECLWFCFYAVLSEELKKFKAYWNSHHIRPSRHDCISGAPDILYYLPERSGGVDNLQEVSDAKLLEMDQQYEVNDREENSYQEYFHFVMDKEGMQYPTNAEEAFNVYQKLMNIAVL